MSSTSAEGALKEEAKKKRKKGRGRIALFSVTYYRQFQPCLAVIHVSN